MNAAFLLMSTAALAGADVAPPPAAHAPHAPVVVSGSGGCNNCGTATAAHSWGHASSRVSILDRVKARFSKTSCGCATPAPAPAPCNTCSKSIADRPNLLDKLKARWGKKSSCCPAPCDPCHSAPAVVTPPAGGGGTTPPKDMPKVDPKKEEKPKDEKPKGGNNSGLPLPLPPISGAGGLSGSTNPY